jgi:hypothetical protein
VDNGHYNAGAAVTGFTNVGDNDLYSGGIYTTTGAAAFSLTLGGLNTSDTYDLFLYVKDPNGAANTLVSGTSGSQTYYLKTISNSLMSSYALATNTTGTGTIPQANYFEFTGLSGSSITASLSSSGVNVSGFQLEQFSGSSSIPEPSTAWLFSLGFLGLGVHLYRTRLAKV